MLLPPMTPDLARLIEQTDIDYSTCRLDGMRQAKGNPLGIEIRQFGPAIAYRIEAWPEFWYGNKVLGLDPSGEAALDDIAAFFGERQLAFRLELMPGRLTASLGCRLHRLGFCQTGFSTALYGVPAAKGSSPAEGALAVREVTSGEIDLFLDLYQDGFGLPRLEASAKRIVRGWLDRARPAVSIYLARADRMPAGVGILYVKEEIGLLADAATLPDFRGSGCHEALIRHRIAEAARRGCELLTSFVEFGSASHRNLGRAGLRVAYTKAVWEKVQ
jgi:GNAT superfamily N-acetyltransferase